jgi:prophage regulatory protein
MADLPIIAPENESYLRFPQVRQRIGLSRTTIHRMVKSGDFPRPRLIGKRAVAWLSSDVARWRAERPEA